MSRKGAKLVARPAVTTKRADESSKKNSAKSPSFWKSLTQTDAEMKESASALFFVQNELKRAESSSKSHTSTDGTDQDDYEGQCDDLLPKRWIDFFCIVGLDEEHKTKLFSSAPSTKDCSPISRNIPCVPTLLDCYPSQQPDMEFPQQLPAFCFPTGCRALRRSRGKSQNIPEPALCHLVLTSVTGNRLYLTTLIVYERMLQGNEADKTKTKFYNPIQAATSISIEHDVWIPKCLVLLSHYPFYHAQSTILKELYYTVASGASPIPFERFVAHTLSIPFPKPSSVVEWKSWTGPGANDKTAMFRLRLLQHLTCTLSLEPLFRTISLSNILVIWATLLQEGKVVLQCSLSNVSLLTPICEALLQLLFPLEWKGIYIPVLPTSSNTENNSSWDILEAPVPYLIGLTSKPDDRKLPQPTDVLFCDLDNDILHLGYNEDGSYVEKLPVLPERPIMRLKIHLEEFADPLYLPSLNGIKGQITTRDRLVTLDNAFREAYAQQTRLFQKPSSQSFSRAYILSQSSKIPARGKLLQMHDFVVSKEDPSRDSNLLCCLLDLFPSEDVDGNVVRTVEDLESPFEEEANGTNNYGKNTSFMASLARSSRHVQVHTDQLLAVFAAQEYATPSSHALAACSDQQFGNDSLNRQDEIAQHFFETRDTDHELFQNARACVLEFFVSMLSRYEFYVDSGSNRLDLDRFLRSSRLSKQQKHFAKRLLTSQMFDSFLHDSRRRRIFDNYVRFSQQRTDNAANSGNTSSRLLLLSVPPPFGLDCAEGKPYCRDRRFPDILKPEELVTERPTWSLWNFVFSDASTRDNQTNKEDKRRLQKMSDTSRRLYPTFGPCRPWFLSLLCVVVSYSNLPRVVDSFSAPAMRQTSDPPCLSRTQSLYQSSMVSDEKFIPLNRTYSTSFAAFDQSVEYDFQQENLGLKKFNSDLHDVAFKRSPLQAHFLLKSMERLHGEDPTNTSLVQPDSMSYATVIESWCQNTRSSDDNLSDGFSAPAREEWCSQDSDTEYFAAFAARDLLHVMECSENLTPSPLNYLFVCQKWAETADSSGRSMTEAQDIFQAYKERMENENSRFASFRYPGNSLAAFYAVLVEGWSRLVGRVDGAMDRAEVLLNEMECACSAAQDQAHHDACVMEQIREKQNENRGDVGPFSLAYTSFIIGISRSKRRDMGRRADAVLQRMKDNGALPDMVVYTSVLSCWSKVTSQIEREMASGRAIQLLDEVEGQYLSGGNYLLKPSQITYSQAIKAVGYSLDPKAPRLAEDILRRMYNLTTSGKIHVPPNVHNYNAVITALSTGGKKNRRAVNARKAERLLYEMVHQSRHEGNVFTEPSVVTLGSVLRAWAESGLPDCGEQAQRVLDHFEARYDSGNSRIRPNVICYTTTMQAWGRSNAPPQLAQQKVNDILSKLENLYMETGNDALRPNQITYITAMDVFIRKFPEKAGSMSQALVDRMSQLHEIGIGYEKPTRLVLNNLINAWSKSSERNAAENAELVFQGMEARYAAGDDSAQPDEVSLCSVLNAWANHAMHGGALRAQQIMDHTSKVLTPEQCGFDHTVVSWNVLIKAWGRSRAIDSVQRAENILVDLETQHRKGSSRVKPDITTYSSVINCCAYYSGPNKGRSSAFDVALRTFHKIKQSDDLVANNIVYGTLFKAMGKLQKAGTRRDMMIQELFGECCRAGQVCSFVLIQLRSTSRDLFLRLVLNPCSLKDRDANDIETVWRSIPNDWKKNVVF